MSYPLWLWIPIVFAAAAAQTVRNAAQKNLIRTAGTLAATSVRFIYGLPFALAALSVCVFSVNLTRSLSNERPKHLQQLRQA